MPRTPRNAVDRLEPRRLLAAATVAVDPLEAAVRDDLGLTADEAADFLAEADPVAAAGRPGSIDYWSDATAYGLWRSGVTDPTVPALAFDVARLDTGGLLDALGRRGDVLLPNPDGGLSRFAAEPYELLAPHVQAANPGVHAFRLRGLDDPLAVGQVTLTPTALTASISSPAGTWHVEPVEAYGRGDAYASYFLAHVPLGADFGDDEPHHDHHDDHDGPAGDPPSPELSFGTDRLRFDLAIGATAEWVATAGGTQQSAFDTIVAAVADVNLVYERDFGVGLRLVSDQRTVFTNSATDGYSNNDSFALLTQNQQKMDAVYGGANYGVGHVLSTSGGGLAYVGVIGDGGFKAQGNSGRNATSSLFEITLMHELGHQFGSSHTFNYIGGVPADQRSASHAYEPGPGSTLMSYGGFGYNGNFVSIRDRYFHTKSVERARAEVGQFPAGAFATTVPVGNAVPSVAAPADRTIPANTPFALAATASDADGDPLAYTWEQYDLGDEDAPGVDDGDGPLFRSRPATASPTRVFPEMADVLAGRVDPDEFLPQISRTGDPLTFRVRATDGRGGWADDRVDLRVIDTGAAFRVTGFDAPATLAAGETFDLTWDVAGTTANGIDVGQVAVSVSYDGGATWTPLATTANDGLEPLVVPADAPDSPDARLRIAAVGNYFFDVNNAPITIGTVVAVPSGLPATLDSADDGAIYPNPAGEFRPFDFDRDPYSFAPFVDAADPTASYLFSPPVDAAYSFVAAEGAGATLDPVLAVYDFDTGAPLAGDDDSGGGTTAAVTIDLLAGRQYVVAVAGRDNVGQGPLLLAVTSDAAPPVSTLPIADGLGSVAGDLADAAEADYFEFVAPIDADGTGLITLDADTADTVLGLYDDADTLLAFADALGDGTPETIDFAAINGLAPGATYRLRVGTFQYAFGTGAYTLSLALGRDPGLPPAPSAPDLLADDDNGPFDDDDVTDLDAGLRFAVMAEPGSLVRLFRGTTQVGGPVLAGVDGFAIVQDGLGSIPDGTADYRATAAFDGGPQSPVSSVTTVTIDTVAPQSTAFALDLGGVAIDPRFAVDFDETVFVADPSLVTVTNLTTGQALPSGDLRLEPTAAGLAVIYDPTGAGDVLPDGNYGLSFAPGAATDLAGNAIGGFAGDAFFLNGDFNRDRAVNLADFTVLANNFGRTSATFAQGDATNDGRVNLADFTILANAFGRTLPGPAAAPPSLFGDDDDRDPTPA